MTEEIWNRDDIETDTRKARDFVRSMAETVRPFQKISNFKSAINVSLTLAAAVASVALHRWADHAAASVFAFLAIGIVQHRMNIIQHEAIHKMLFTNRFFNEFLGHHFFGAAILTPHTYRLYHFKHHRELGRHGDPDKPGYTRFPTTEFGVIGFVLENLFGFGVVSRFLAETKSALRSDKQARDYHVDKGWVPAFKAWLFVGAVQGLIWSLFLASGGGTMEFVIFWVIPEITLTRTLMAVRLMGEHTPHAVPAPEDVRYLVSLPCSFLERLLFAPMGFNFHAEHHLFPAVPWHRLGALHKKLMESPDYTEIVEVRPGYIHAIFTRCILGKVGAR